MSPGKMMPPVSTTVARSADEHSIGRHDGAAQQRASGRADLHDRGTVAVAGAIGCTAAACIRTGGYATVGFAAPGVGHSGVARLVGAALFALSTRFLDRAILVARARACGSTAAGPAAQARAATSRLAVAAVRSDAGGRSLPATACVLRCIARARRDCYEREADGEQRH
jgi:hypothetical protein